MSADQPRQLLEDVQVQVDRIAGASRRVGHLIAREDDRPLATGEALALLDLREALEALEPKLGAFRRLLDRVLRDTAPDLQRRLRELSRWTGEAELSSARQVNGSEAGRMTVDRVDKGTDPIAVAGPPSNDATESRTFEPLGAPQTPSVQVPAGGDGMTPARSYLVTLRVHDESLAGELWGYQDRILQIPGVDAVWPDEGAATHLVLTVRARLAQDALARAIDDAARSLLLSVPHGTWDCSISQASTDAT